MNYSVILPNSVAREIDERLDAEIAKYPDAADSRAFFRMQVIGHWAEFGEVPDFSLEPRARGTEAGTDETAQQAQPEGQGPGWNAPQLRLPTP